MGGAWRGVWTRFCAQPRRRRPAEAPCLAGWGGCLSLSCDSTATGRSWDRRVEDADEGLKKSPLARTGVEFHGRKEAKARRRSRGTRVAPSTAQTLHLAQESLS